MDGKTIQLAWEGDYGPDGPWQAIRLGVGSTMDNRTLGNPIAMMWPDCGAVSKVLTPALGGEYAATNSSSAVIVSTEAGADMKGMEIVNRESWSGSEAFDIVNEIFPYFQVNASLDVVEKWGYSLPSEANFLSAPVGILGLGAYRSHFKGSPPGILHQLKADDSISSMSFGMHMGSVALGQRASLVLGGYDQNRALGPVAVFKFATPYPTFDLLDVLLGTQVGASPFANPDRDEGSVWGGIDNNPGDITEATTEEQGLRPVVAKSDPTLPYIYLPLGTCEAAARRLPVTWNSILGLYLWNTDDPAYQRIVRSPAYLSFVFADHTATNITIKVPFRLLDLTLGPPLIPTPTPYFPCKPLNTTSTWVLGRAFLQAAFVGVSFEQNITFLAQAPGPGVVQKAVRSLGLGDTTLQTNPIEEFEQTWLSSWTILEEKDILSSSGSPSAEPSSGGNGGLSTGSVVGIVVGIVATLVVAIVTVWFFWRRKTKQKQAESFPSGAEVSTEWAASTREQQEMDGQAVVAELGKPYGHELHTPSEVHELPIDNWNLPPRMPRTNKADPVPRY